MNINSANLYHAYGVTQNQSYTIPWGPKAEAKADTYQEAQVRHIIADDEALVVELSRIEGGHVARNSDCWSGDLDPAKGRALVKSRQSLTADLQGGKVNAAESASFVVPSHGNVVTPVALDISTDNGNIAEHSCWKDGVFQSGHKEKVLKNGSREILDIQVNEARGTLTFMASLIPAP